MKFKIGDVIVGNEKSNYKYTITTKNRDWKGKVIKIYDNDEIQAQTITTDGTVGRKYQFLKVDYFELSYISWKERLE